MSKLAKMLHTTMLHTTMCVCLAMYGTQALAAEPADEAQSRKTLEQRLDEAQKRLDAAAREVAELSMSLSDRMVPMPPLPPIPGDRGALGIVLGPDRDRHEDGVEIMSVSPGGAAADAGLKPGDVLLQIDGQSLARDNSKDPHEKLLSHMREVKPDEKVTLRYRREGKTHDVELVARPMRSHIALNRRFGPTAQQLIGRMPEFAFFRAEGVFGSAELVAMTPKLGQYFGTDKGLLVVRAPEDSRLKLEEGDVILDIDGRVPSSPSHAFRILSSYQGGEKLKLNVMRAKKRLTFDIVIPDDPVRPSRFELRRSLPGQPVESAGAPASTIVRTRIQA